MTARKINIAVINSPRLFKVFLSSLPKSVNDTTDVEDGNIIPEVDYATKEIKLACLPQPILAYQLRAPRRVRLPGHVFGKMKLGEAFATAIPITFKVPSVGGHTILQPQITPEQNAIMSLYNYCKANAIWIINVPAPIGTALVLRVMAPELEGDVDTKGIRWKVQTVNGMVVYLPWNNDVSVVPIGSGREGQSGLAIKIQTVENNSSESVQTTLTGVAWCIVTDIDVSALNNSGFKGETPKGLSFIPISKPLPPPPDPEESLYFGYDDTPEEEVKVVCEHMDNSNSIEVQAEGVNNLAENISIDNTPTRQLATHTEKPVLPPLPPTKGTKGLMKKDQTGILNTVWVELPSVTLSDANLGKTLKYDIDPMTLNKSGENLSLPFRRNVWCSGSRKAGYVRTLVVKCLITRSPNISGSVICRDSKNISSQYVLEQGGNIEFTVMPTLFAEPRVGVFRDANNPWMRTDQMKCSFTYTNLIVNRNDNTNDVAMTVMCKIGDTIFQAPTRPKKQVLPSRMKELLFLTKQLNIAEEQYEMSLREEAKQYAKEIREHSGEDLGLNYRGEPNTLNDRPHYAGQKVFNHVTGEYQDASIYMDRNEMEGPEWAEDYDYDDDGKLTPESRESWRATLVPKAAGEAESGEANIGGAYEEDIDQDDFWVKAFDEEIAVGETAVIPLNFAVIEDAAGDGTTNPITQKFERFAQIVPISAGQFGPKIGNYTCQIRLPTDMTASVEHVTLPGDMNADAAIRVFGLSSILSMATSALTSIGGPMLSGIINTGRELLGGLGGILGGRPPEEKKQDPSATPAAIAGGIDVSRFINFLKPILNNEMNEPTFGSLLLEITKLFSKSGSTREVTKLPVEVFIRMDKCAVERTVINRALTPVKTGMKNRVYIPMDAYSRIIEAFFSNEKTFRAGTHQNVCFVQFMSSIFSSDFKSVIKRSVSLDEVLERPVQKGDYTQLMSRIIEASREDQ
jgi:hypothetical protein